MRGILAAKKLHLTFLAGLVILALGAPAAQAQTFTFNIANDGLAQCGDPFCSGDWGTITLTQNGDNVDVIIDSGSGLSLFGMSGAVGFFESGLSFSNITVSGGKSTFTPNSSIGEMDGFGVFNSGFTDGTLGLGKGGGATELRFTVNGATIADLQTTNSTGYWVAIQEGPTGGGLFTGFAGIGDPIPEPASIALFGTGLLGLAGLIRRRRKASAKA